MKTKEEIAAYYKAYNAANKEQVLARQKKYRQAHREQKVAYNKAYCEANRKQIAAQRKVYREINKEQLAAYMKVYRADNKEQLSVSGKAYHSANRNGLLDQMKAYAAAHPNEYIARKHKARAKSFKVKIGDEKAILAWMNGWRAEAPVACHYCKAVAPGTKMEIDHVIPMSKGGDHDLPNLVVCCKSCNCAKGDKLLEVWQAQINL
mgnify:CR=1 FL=1